MFYNCELDNSILFFIMYLIFNTNSRPILIKKKKLKLAYLIKVFIVFNIFNLIKNNKIFVLKDT